MVLVIPWAECEILLYDEIHSGATPSPHARPIDHIPFLSSPPAATSPPMP